MDLDAQADPLTAPEEAVPSRSAGHPHSLADCARAFAARPSPWVMSAGLLVAMAARLAAGPLGWRDLVVVALVLVAFPVTEWAIHVYLLHARPIRIWRWRVDLLTTREHRAHHEAPAVLDGVLIPVYGILIFLALIALTVYGLSFPLHVALGGNRIAGALTATFASYAILLTYEWCHFLIHTPYRPRGRYYRSIWRSHRLHHFQNEHYWFGVTTNLGDRVLGTFPDQRTVSRSPTARTLGVDGP
jgi:Fatty acid hydroxylase superfamily